MHRTEGRNNVNGLFTQGDLSGVPPTCVDAQWLNAVQEELLNVVEYFGGPVYEQDNDEHDSLYKAFQKLRTQRKPGYSVKVSSQEEFNAIIERTGANTYKISDDIVSVILSKKNPYYLCYGAQSFLSGGDTWGYIQTNDCTHFEAEMGATLDVGGTVGYVLITSDYTTLKNVVLRGSGYAGFANSFIINAGASYAHLIGCKVINRKSNLAIGTTNIFSNGDPTNYTNKFTRCAVIGCECAAGTAMRAFSAHNTVGCFVVGTKVYGKFYGFYGSNMSACSVLNTTVASGASFYGFRGVYNISSCIVDGVGPSGDLYGFYQCRCASACVAKNIISDDGSVGAFSTCTYISGCMAQTIQSVAVATTAHGFAATDELSCCSALGITSTAGTAEGFHDCNYGSSLYSDNAANASNDWINTSDAAIANKYSCPAIWT